MSNTGPSITGEIILINPEQQVSDKFKKRTFVVKTSDQYPQEIELQFAQDKCEKLDGFKVGDNVEVGYNLRGRGFDKKDGSGRAYFNTIEAWMIKKSDASAPATGSAAAPTFYSSDADNDLPF